MFSLVLEHALVDKKMTRLELSRQLGWAPSNLSMKMARDNFSEKDMLKIAKALEMDLKIELDRKSTPG